MRALRRAPDPSAETDTMVGRELSDDRRLHKEIAALWFLGRKMIGSKRCKPTSLVRNPGTIACNVKLRDLNI